MLCERDLAELVKQKLQQERQNLIRYLVEDPFFQSSLVPCGVRSNAPPLARLMSRVSFQAGVGPMAAVAGAINDRIGVLVHSLSREFMLENGGDLLVCSSQDRVVGVYTGGRSPFHNRLGIMLDGGQLWGVATSSREVGPSLNFGGADSVTVLAGSSAVADAWATRLANEVKQFHDVERILDFSSRFPEIEGVVICIGDHMGARGTVRLTEVKM